MARKPTLAAAFALALACLAPTASAAVPAQRTHGPDFARIGAAPAPSLAVAASAGEHWCANRDAAANQVDNGEYRYHAIYAYAADGPSRLAGLGAQLEGEAFDASALIERQYGRAIRFDIGTPCGHDQLDISAIQLPFTRAQLASFATQGGTATFEAVAEALRQRGFGLAADAETAEQLAARRENYLVWLDGPAPASSCGQGTALLDDTRSETNLNNFGGKLAVIFRHDGDFCGSDVVRHEIGHNLGALQPDAPNTTDGVHCNDAFEDTMCGFASPKVASGPFNGLYFDYHNDDYWDPPHGAPLGWWTVNLSRFICPDKDCNRPHARESAVAARRAEAASRTERKRTRAAHRLRRPHLTRRVRRGSRHVRLRLRARGHGTARLVVRCPHRAHRHGVISRRIALPSVVHVKTTCRSPRSRLVRWHRPRAGRFGS